jgi:putative phage-type endonuclease
VIQGSPEWFAARCGKVTASRVKDVLAKTKAGWGQSRADYLLELVAERLTGAPAVSYTNTAMQWGKDHEAQARAAYELMYDPVQEVGFIDHPSLQMTGASPDGLVDEDGLIEIKCPYSSAVHVEYVTSRKVPQKYLTQIQWQLECTHRDWAHFVSFDPRMPDGMKLFVKEVARGPSIEQDVKQFLIEVDLMMEELRSKK